MAGLRTEPLVDLIGDFYKAAVTPADWETALAGLAQATGSIGAALIVHDRGAGRGYVAHSYGIGDRHIESYAHQYALVNPWLAKYENGADFNRAFGGDSVLPFMRLRKTLFYRGFQQPQGLHHTLHAGISKSGSTEVHLLLGRPDSRGRYEASEIDIVQDLVEHIARAWQIVERQAAAETLGRKVLAALDRLAVGVVILGRDGHILAINTEARKLIGSGDGVATGPDGLEVFLNGQRWKLHNLLTGDGRAAGRFELLTVRRSAGLGPLAVLAAPLPAADGAADDAAGAMVFITDPYRPAPRLDSSMMCSLYALTPAEARLASRMVYGKGLDGAARELGISIHTARTHLKRIFEKTGVARQAELVHVLQNTFGFLRSECTAQESPQHD